MPFDAFWLIWQNRTFYFTATVHVCQDSGGRSWTKEEVPVRVVLQRLSKEQTDFTVNILQNLDDTHACTYTKLQSGSLFWCSALHHVLFQWKGKGFSEQPLQKSCVLDCNPNNRSWQIDELKLNYNFLKVEYLFMSSHFHSSMKMDEDKGVS